MAIYLYTGDGEVTGPHTGTSLAARVHSGEISRDTLATREGSDDWQPLHTLLPLSQPAARPAAAAKPAARPAPRVPVAGQSTAAAEPQPITDLAQLRQHTVYPFIRLLANVVALLGLVVAAVLMILGLMQIADEGYLGAMLAGQALFTAAVAMLFRESVHLGADIGDRLHQTARRDQG